MPTLAQFYADVSTEIARGTTQNARIPGWCRRAVSMLEQGCTFEYMRTTGDISLDPDSMTPFIVDLPSARVKSIQLVRAFDSTGQGRIYGENLQRVDQLYVTSLDIGQPAGYWLIGSNQIGFDACPGEVQSFEIVYNEYTDWPTDTTASPTLLQRYENLLLAETLRSAYTSLRDTDLAQMWQQDAMQARQMVAYAEEDLKWQGRRLAAGQRS